MRQYLDVKRQYRDAIVFFRMGDFYEMFYEDALAASRVLELTLTSRAKDASGGAIPMCGLPFHAADAYVARLVRKGYRVAICDQVEDPRKAKGIVKREVTRVVSPGTFTDASYLDAREPAFLAAVTCSRGDGRSGASRTSTSPPGNSPRPNSADRAESQPCGELAMLRPREILAADGAAIDDAVGLLASPTVTRVAEWSFEPAQARSDCVNSCGSRRWSRTASRMRPRQFPPPGPSCCTCAKRRRATSRTCATSRGACRRRPADRSGDTAPPERG
jgi:DNA mismatch repair protein MutS